MYPLVSIAPSNLSARLNFAGRQPGPVPSFGSGAPPQRPSASCQFERGRSMHPLGNPSSLKLSPRPSSIAGAVALSLNEIGLVLVSRPRPTQRVMLHTIFCFDSRDCRAGGSARLLRDFHSPLSRRKENSTDGTRNRKKVSPRKQ